MYLLDRVTAGFPSSLLLAWKISSKPQNGCCRFFATTLMQIQAIVLKDLGLDYLQLHFFISSVFRALTERLHLWHPLPCTLLCAWFSRCEKRSSSLCEEIAPSYSGSKREITQRGNCIVFGCGLAALVSYSCSCTLANTSQTSTPAVGD